MNMVFRPLGQVMDELVAHPRSRNTTGYSHADSKFLLRLPYAARSEQANEILLRQHRKLAYKVALKVWKSSPRISNAIEFEDILAGAYEGLLTALERFNPGMGHQFSTYATSWIWQKAKRELENNGYAVHIPVHFQAKMRAARWGDPSLTKDELAQVGRTNHFFGQVVSTNHQLPEGDGELSDFLMPEHLEYLGTRRYRDNPENRILESNLRERLCALIRAKCNPRDAQIIVMKYGFDDDGHERTLQDVAKRVGISRERVRQICEKFIRKAANNSHVDENDLSIGSDI